MRGDSREKGQRHSLSTMRRKSTDMDFTCIEPCLFTRTVGIRLLYPLGGTSKQQKLFKHDPNKTPEPSPSKKHLRPTSKPNRKNFSLSPRRPWLTNLADKKDNTPRRFQVSMGPTNSRYLRKVLESCFRVSTGPTNSLSRSVYFRSQHTSGACDALPLRQSPLSERRRSRMVYTAVGDGFEAASLISGRGGGLGI